jgi:hypothetical protein
VTVTLGAAVSLTPPPPHQAGRQALSQSVSQPSQAAAAASVRVVVAWLLVQWSALAPDDLINAPDIFRLPTVATQA